MLELATLEKVVCACVCWNIHSIFTNQDSDSLKVVEEGKEEEVLETRMLTMAGFFDIWNSPQHEVIPLA